MPLRPENSSSSTFISLMQYRRRCDVLDMLERRGHYIWVEWASAREAKVAAREDVKAVCWLNDTQGRGHGVAWNSLTEIGLTKARFHQAGGAASSSVANIHSKHGQPVCRLAVHFESQMWKVFVSFQSCIEELPSSSRPPPSMSSTNKICEIQIDS